MKTFILAHKTRMHVDYNDYLVVNSHHAAITLDADDKLNIESVETDNVWRIYLNYSSGTVRILRYESTQDMLKSYQEIIEWLKS